MASRQSKASRDSTPTRHLEIETKLEVDANTVLPNLTGRRALVAVGLVDVGDPVVFELDAVYFDTAQLDLLRSKLTLRHRTGGEDAGWHLKLPALAGARTEIGLPPDADLADPLAARVPDTLADLVQGAARGRELRPVARIRNRRTVRRLLDANGAAMVELADDQVTSTTLTPGTPEIGTLTVDGEGPAGAPGHIEESAPTTWRELEVEVVNGNRGQLAAVVTLLSGAGAKPAVSASKLARALNSAAPPPARKTKESGQAVALALGKLRDMLIVADRALREGTEGALPDARAARSRIGSVLQVYSSLFAAGSTDRLQEQLQDFGAVLEAAGDLQMLHRRLGGQLNEEPAEYASVALGRIDAEFATVRPAAVAAVAEWIRSDSYLAMLRELDEFVSTPPFSRRATKAATAELSTQLAAAWRDLRSLVDQALADPSESPVLHEVHQGAGALRYAAEAASATLGESTVVFAAAIEEVQEVLGEHQDALSTAAWLAELARRPDTDGVAGFVFGRLHAFEQAVAHGCLDDFADAWDRVEDGELLEEPFSR